MSVHASAYVWEHSKHKGSELLLLLAIADFAHANGFAFPSVLTLARRIRMSERNTQRLIQKLASSGELKVKTQAGPNGTHAYQIVMNLTLPLFAVDNPIRGGDKLSPVKLSGDNEGKKGVTKEAIGGDKAMAPEPKEQQKNQEKALRATRLPKDFQISNNVRAWAKARGWDHLLDSYLEAFKRKCEARGAKYADWDRAFENCIADDWGRIRARLEAQTGRPVGSSGEVKPWWKIDAGVMEQGKKLGVKTPPGKQETFSQYTARVFLASGDGPWLTSCDANVRSYMDDIVREENRVASS